MRLMWAYIKSLLFEFFLSFEAFIIRNISAKPEIVVTCRLAFLLADAPRRQNSGSSHDTTFHHHF